MSLDFERGHDISLLVRTTSEKYKKRVTRFKNLKTTFFLHFIIEIPCFMNTVIRNMIYVSFSPNCVVNNQQSY